MSHEANSQSGPNQNIQVLTNGWRSGCSLSPLAGCRGAGYQTPRSRWCIHSLLLIAFLKLPAMPQPGVTSPEGSNMVIHLAFCSQKSANRACESSPTLGYFLPLGWEQGSPKSLPAPQFSSFQAPRKRY